MSTVGYGDIVPKTGAGKVLGSVVVFLSMIFLALPMTIIVSKFSSCYDDLKYQDEDDRYYESSDEDEDDGPADFSNHKAWEESRVYMHGQKYGVLWSEM